VPDPVAPGANEPSRLLGPSGPRRFVWCASGGRRLYGRTRPGPAPRPGFWQRLFGLHPQGGTLYEFEAIEREAALAALEAHLGLPGSFSIETAEGARLDLLASRKHDSVTVDCWFLEADEDLDALVITRAGAHELVQTLFETDRDREVARKLRELAARAARLAA
jgi:hypothetical protein